MITPHDPHSHTAPLKQLVQRMHGGRSLADNVRRLRWRRRKAPVATPGTPPATPEVLS